jgi:hypothetical protein
VQTLAIHGSVPKAIAIGMVEAAPFVLSTILALAIGLGRVRAAPRTLLFADCVLRSLTFGTLGFLSVTGRLTLPVLIAGLLFGATFRMAGSSSRRLLATSPAGERGRFVLQRLTDSYYRRSEDHANGGFVSRSSAAPSPASTSNGPSHAERSPRRTLP